MRGVNRRIRKRTRGWRSRLAAIARLEARRRQVLHAIKWPEARRRRLLHRILNTPPLLTDSPAMREGELAPLEVHVLCCWGDYIQAIWAVKSFYHYSHARFPLVIHLQGYVPPDVLPALACHFPGARILTQTEADAVVEPWLVERGFCRLFEMRRSLAPMLKLTDFSLMSRAQNVISFDPDVLFFRYPADLLVADGSPLTYRLFQRDGFYAYTIEAKDALSDLAIELVPRLNSGIMAFARDSVHLSACERFMQHPRLAQKHWHLDQTLHALDACASGEVRYLPESYVLDLDPHPHPEELVARHYVSTIRPLLVSEGVASLVRGGLLSELAFPT